MQRNFDIAKTQMGAYRSCLMSMLTEEFEHNVTTSSTLWAIPYKQT